MVFEWYFFVRESVPLVTNVDLWNPPHQVRYVRTLHDIVLAFLEGNVSSVYVAVGSASAYRRRCLTLAQLRLLWAPEVLPTITDRRDFHALVEQV